MVVITPGTHDGVGDGVMDAVGVFDPVAVDVALPSLCGHPPAGKGVPTGLALAGGPGSATPTRSPLAAKLFGTMALTLASSTQLASPKRSSVKAKA